MSGKAEFGGARLVAQSETTIGAAVFGKRQETTPIKIVNTKGKTNMNERTPAEMDVNKTNQRSNQSWIYAILVAVGMMVPLVWIADHVKAWKGS